MSRWSCVDHHGPRTVLEVVFVYAIAVSSLIQYARCPACIFRGVMTQQRGYCGQNKVSIIPTPLELWTLNANLTDWCIDLTQYVSSLPAVHNSYCLMEYLTLVVLHLPKCFRAQGMDSRVNLSTNGITLLYKLLDYFYGKAASWIWFRSFFRMGESSFTVVE